MVKAIIIDLDGTLYNSSGRKHYVEKKPRNYDAFHKASVFDPPNQWCKEIINRFGPEYRILFVSGREDKYRQLTYDWLLKHDIGFLGDSVFMRKTGDYRKDWIIKKEIYESEIKERFDVLFVLDDRKQVVDMWRAQGLVVLHCAEGEF